MVFGKYAGMDHLDLACARSLLSAQLREPSGANPRMLEDWQSNLKAAMDSTTAGQGDELVDTQEARALWDDVNLETAVAPLFNTVQMPSIPIPDPTAAGRGQLVSRHGEHGGHRLRASHGAADADGPRAGGRGAVVL